MGDHLRELEDSDSNGLGQCDLVAALQKETDPLLQPFGGYMGVVHSGHFLPVFNGAEPPRTSTQVGICQLSFRFCYSLLSVFC